MEKSYAEQYALLEGEHWWFRARRMVLRTLLAQLEWPQQPRILEIGVGPGNNLVEVYPPDARLEGIEPDERLARLAASRGPARSRGRQSISVCGRAAWPQNRSRGSVSVPDPGPNQ